VLVFIVSAASFGFYLSALSSQASHPPPSSVFIQYDVADGRDRSPDRSRPTRDRQQAMLSQSRPVKQRRQEPRHPEQPVHQAATGQAAAGTDNSYLNLLGRIFSSAYAGI
jgi:hypothetical protein